MILCACSTVIVECSMSMAMKSNPACARISVMDAWAKETHPAKRRSLDRRRRLNSDLVRVTFFKLSPLLFADVLLYVLVAPLFHQLKPCCMHDLGLGQHTLGILQMQLRSTVAEGIGRIIVYFHEQSLHTGGDRRPNQ